MCARELSSEVSIVFATREDVSIHTGPSQLLLLPPKYGLVDSPVCQILRRNHSPAISAVGDIAASMNIEPQLLICKCLISHVRDLLVRHERTLHADEKAKEVTGKQAERETHSSTSI